MKDKKKLSKMGKRILREIDMNMKIVTRFLNDEEYSIPCGSSPGMFLGELFQLCNNPHETDPFSIYAAGHDDLLAARRICILSGEEDAGGCMISLGRRTCDVNGRHYTISDTACIQIKPKEPDICCSLFIDAGNVFAAELFADTSDRCFMIVDAADSDRICVPLNGFRLFSMNGKTRREEGTGLLVECMKPSYNSMHGGIICGAAFDRIRRTLWTDGCIDKLKRR